MRDHTKLRAFELADEVASSLLRLQQVFRRKSCMD